MDIQFHCQQHLRADVHLEPRIHLWTVLRYVYRRRCICMETRSRDKGQDFGRHDRALAQMTFLLRHA